MDKPFGIDLKRFSTKPPPVIWAAAFNKFLSTNFKISLEYILVGFNNSFFKYLGNLFFIIDLIKEKPLECNPLEGTAKIISPALTYFFLISFFGNYTYTKSS